MRRRDTSDCGALLDFEEVRRRLRLGTRTDLGRQEIQIAQVIGSVGRAHEFDGCFRPRSVRMRRVLDQIRASRPDAADLPILLNQVDQGYFVVDGHKRMSLAVAEGRLEIDAEVTSWATRFHVARGTTIDEVRSTDEEVRFREVTGLDKGVPDARFPLSDPDGYLDLEESVKAHAFDLSRERGELVPAAAAARHWYEVVFQRAIGIARDAGVDRLLSSCSEAELFLVMRRGNRGGFEPGWTVREAAADRGVRNLRAVTPGRISAGLRRLRGRRGPPEVLPEEPDGHRTDPPAAAD